MVSEKARLTLDLDVPLHRRLKAIAALKGVPMREYCQTAIEHALQNETAAGIEPLPWNEDSLNRMDALRTRLFGDGILPGDSVEDLREARAIRDEQLDTL